VCIAACYQSFQCLVFRSNGVADEYVVSGFISSGVLPRSHIFPLRNEFLHTFSQFLSSDLEPVLCNIF